MPYDLRRKTVKGHVYLYHIFDRGGNGTSLDPMNDENQARFERYHAARRAQGAHPQP